MVPLDISSTVSFISDIRERRRIYDIAPLTRMSNHPKNSSLQHHYNTNHTSDENVENSTNCSKAKRISTLGKAQWVSSFKLSAKVIKNN